MSAATELNNVPDVPIDRTRRRRAWLTAFRTPSGIVGLILMFAVVILALMSLFGLTQDPAHQNVADSLKSPSPAHWFGTDQFGRDVFARVASGLANSLRISIVSVAVAAVAGTVLGVLGGYYQGVLDRLVGIITNVLFAFPSLLLALALAATLERNWVTVSISIAIVYLPIFARVARGPVLTLRTAEYVLASTAIGRGRLSTLFEHVIPNMRGILVVQITLSLSWAILTEASLSFLGFGTPPPAASLGGMVYDAQTLSSVAPWMLLFPGAALIIAVIGLNLLGDGPTCRPRSQDGRPLMTAGGSAALVNSAESAEDDAETGVTDLGRLAITPLDTVVGIASSGRTPYVIAALRHAAGHGALTVGLSCNLGTPISSIADHGIEIPVGPEIVTGSTRLAAGTATKMVLNMFSTIGMVRLGKTYRTLMVDVKATNAKLLRRAIRIVTLATGADEDTARRALDAADWHAKIAIAIIATGMDPAQARAALETVGGVLGKVIDH